MTYPYGAILSRCQDFEFKLASKEEVKKALNRATEFLENKDKIKISISLGAAAIFTE